MGVVLHYYLFISLYLFLSEKLSVPSVFIRSASTSHMQRLRGLHRCKLLGGDEGFHEGCCWVCLFVSFFFFNIHWLSVCNQMSVFSGSSKVFSLRSLPEVAAQAGRISRLV